MFPRLEKILLGSKFACIEAQFLEDGIIFHLSILQRNNNIAKSILIKKNITDIGNLRSLIDKKTPAVLIVSGKGVISRKVPLSSEAGEEVLVRAVLSSGITDDLLVSPYSMGEIETMISISRKDHVTRLLSELAEVSIVSVLLGAGCVLDHVDLFGNQTEELQFGNHTIKFLGGRVSEVLFTARDRSGQIVMGGETIPEESVLSFIGALQGLSYTGSIPGEVKEFSGQRKNFIRMKRYGVSAKVSILFLFLILLINFLVFTHLRNKKSELESDPALISGQASQYYALQEELLNSRKIFESNGMNRSASFSWVADQVAKNVPDDITLSQLSIAPADNFNREDTVGFVSDRISISGTCRESTSLDEWLSDLQQEEWVQSAIITNYNNVTNDKYRSGENDGRGKFELELIFR
jgi:Tfp pilus assembly protein PilN